MYKIYEYSILELKKSLREWTECKEWYLKVKAPGGVISLASDRITDLENGIRELEKLQNNNQPTP